MPHDSLPTPSYRIKECSDLMADGCLCDEQRNLVFLSLWGRDTAVQEFLARLTLGAAENGLTHVHLLTEPDVTLPVVVGNVDALDKRTTRAFRRTLFGSLVHLWLFDKRCVEPDKANASALAILRKDVDNRTERLWTLVRDTCPLPLLDHWCDTVLEMLRLRAMLSPLPLALGPIEGHRLAIDVPALTRELGELIRSDLLCISPSELKSTTPLRRVA